MLKNNAWYLVAGIVIGSLIGALTTLAFKKSRYAYFSPSPNISRAVAGRMDTITGEVWIYDAPVGGQFQWSKLQ